MKVLLVEDDAAIASSLQIGLEASGFTVQHVTTGEQAVGIHDCDIVLLDIGLPDFDGFEVCRRIRAKSDVPIIMLTARNEEIDRIFGLEIGADDYVTKPFGLRELIARIRAVTRRRRASQSEGNTVFTIGPLSVDISARRAVLNNVELELTTKEFDLLAHLAEHPGVVHRRTDIMESVWDTNWYGPTKTLDAHIAAVRKKMGDPRWIEAVRGVGFRLEQPQ